MGEDHADDTDFTDGFRFNIIYFFCILTIIRR